MLLEVFGSKRLKMTIYTTCIIVRETNFTISHSFTLHYTNQSDREIF